MLYLEAFSFALVWFSTLCLTGDACNISQVTVHVGEDAKLLFCRSANDTSKHFRGYRVWKNEDTNIFITLSSAIGTGNCTENATLREFCTSRTVFSAHNQTHLLLKIKHTIQSDEGLYGVGTVFKNLSANHLEKTNLSVIELKFDGMSTVPTSLISTIKSDQPTGSYSITSSTPTSASAFIPIFPMANILFGYFLLFEIMNILENF